MSAPCPLYPGWPSNGKTRAKSVRYVARAERTVQPTETQRARLDALHDALVEASDRMRISCTATATPLAPTARLEIMWDRLRAIGQAVAWSAPRLKLSIIP